jgi:monofunctional biosynthetic peptidoglycan transglycosylase
MVGRTRRLRNFWRRVAQAALGFVLVSVLQVASLRILPPFFTAMMLQRSYESLFSGELPKRDYRWVPQSRISRNLRRAVVAAEDGEFYRHQGFNWDAIEEAWVEYQRGERRRGASTVSMQLSRNLYLGNARNWIRKGLEAYYTVLLEFFLPKDRILELYLNVIEWGDGVYGSEAAARTYYRLPASKLNAGQAARLAACIPNPRRFHPLQSSAYLDWYARSIERRM